MPSPLSSPVDAKAPRAQPSRHNVAVLSHAQYVPTLTAAAALRVKAALNNNNNNNNTNICKTHIVSIRAESEAPYKAAW